MRVGVLNTWLSERYLPFWEAYLGQLNIEVIHPQSQAEQPPSPVSLVVQQAQSLKNQGVDFLLLPDIQLGVESHKGSPSPWMIDLEASLSRVVAGLPPAIKVPAELSLELAGLAASIGQTLSRNPMTARRALERTKTLLHSQYKAPRQAGSSWVGLVAQPILLDNPAMLSPLRQALESHHLNLFLADKSPPELRLEGHKLGLGLELPTDLEAAGMHRYFSRLGKIKGILYLHDDEYAPLPNPLRKLVQRDGSNKPWAWLGTGDNPQQVVDVLAKGLEL